MQMGFSLTWMLITGTSLGYDVHHLPFLGGNEIDSHPVLFLIPGSAHSQPLVPTLTISRFCTLCNSQNET
jgi:hypothetical protein